MPGADSVALERLRTDSRSALHTISVVLAIGQGGNLSRIKNEEWLIKKLLRKFEEPSVDTSMTFAQYQKYKKIADDKNHPKQKAAADRILSAKAAPGNWTAARYTSTRRKVAEVEAKTMVVLDVDHATPAQTQDIRNGFVPASRFAWVGHTSRSHCPEKPKFRMAFPTTREMTVEEAHAVHRLLSTYLADDPQEGIEMVDAVTFRTNQTMFFPSISTGQDYWHEAQPGEILDVDQFLANHPGWEDHLNLPYNEREHQRGLKDPNAKMEDPRQKPNPIGAFCRAYPIEDAIETFLEDIYLPGTSETEVRYTYAAGGSYNGAIVYDEGLFLYSNHESDPIQGAANAWDLVRVHKFGHLDEKVRDPEASPSQLPSYKEMVKLAQRDPLVAAEEFAGLDDVLDDDVPEVDGERVKEPAESEHKPGDVSKDDRFADILDGDEGQEDADSGSDDPADMLDDLDDDDDEEPKKEKAEKETPWQANFRRKANGDLDPVLNNVALICMNDRRIAPCIGFNEFTMDPVCLKPIRAPNIATPSPEVPRQDRRHGRKWEDRDDTSISLIASANAERGGYECDFAELKIQQAVIAAGSDNPIHPVKDFIQTNYKRWLKEGRPRGELERLAIDYLGTPDTVFHRESAKMFIVAAVARIYEPGCKFDVMAIIEGPTGSGKSTFWRTLFGSFFSELKADLEDTGRLVEALRGNWALEMAEMRAAKRTDANTLKMQLSSSEDQHRLAYARREMRFKRQSVFVGTSNENDYLSDPTSNRRYWVWRTKKDLWDKIDNPGLSERLWAIIGEAYQVYLDMREKQPEGDLWLDLHSRTAILEQQQIAEGSRKRTVTEEVADVIADWLQEPRPADEVMVDKAGMTLDGHEGDETPMVRNMVCATEAYEQLRHHPLLSAYQRLDPRTFGRALGHVKGWTSLGKCRRHGVLAPWYFRDQDGPRWVPAPEDDDILS